MNDSGTRTRRFVTTCCGALLYFALAVGPAVSGERRSVGAQSGVANAAAAAAIWSADARLVYVENDEDLDAAGTAPRWGYLYYSPARNQARAYSVRDERILAAENLEMKFESPPLEAGWIDSDAAVRAADAGGGSAFCREHQGRLSTMLLMRGAFQDRDPDAATWTVLYASPHAPSLFVMVDAADGRVRRIWRG